jgi:phage baseplate assembly protein V
MNTETILADLARRVANMIRVGRIAAVDHAAQRVRVDCAEIRTTWLPWQTQRAGATRTWDPPTVGEQVMILSPSGELAAGIVIPALYCQDHPAPDASPTTHVVDYPDGARISYDHATGALAASGVTTAVVQASGSITCDTPQTTFTGAVTVEGLLTYRSGLRGAGGAGASAIIDGDIQATGSITEHIGAMP